MTMARPVYREQVVMVSRRTVQRQLLFVPDDVINGIFLYCLGYAAKKYKIKVISVTVMSNHWHVVIFDEKGTYPAFTSWMITNSRPSASTFIASGLKTSGRRKKVVLFVLKTTRMCSGKWSIASVTPWRPGWSPIGKTGQGSGWVRLNGAKRSR